MRKFDCFSRVFLHWLVVLFPLYVQLMAIASVELHLLLRLVTSVTPLKRL
ncbi:peroxisomal enoyl-coa hydratase, putative, partial [Trypanosoma cruzi]